MTEELRCLCNVSDTAERSKTCMLTKVLIFPFIMEPSAIDCVLEIIHMYVQFTKKSLHIGKIKRASKTH